MDSESAPSFLPKSFRTRFERIEQRAKENWLPKTNRAIDDGLRLSRLPGSSFNKRRSNTLLPNAITTSRTSVVSAAESR